MEDRKSAVSSSLRCQNLADQNEESNLVFNYPMILIHGRLTKDSAASHIDSISSQKLEIVSCGITDDTEADRSFGVGNVEQKEEGMPEAVHIGLSESSESADREQQTPNYRIEKLTEAILEPNNAMSDNLAEKQASKVISKQKIICHASPLDHTMSWPISEDGESKIFVPLSKGKNVISLKHEKSEDVLYQIELTYEPLQNNRYVKPVYIVCKNSDGTFDAPSGEENSVESAVERIAFNARILQTFTAENLNAHGFGRKTFRLQEDENGCVNVNVFKSKLEMETAHKMTGPELYEYFKEELKDSELHDPLCKFWVFMSCSRYKPPNTEEGFDHYSKIPHYIKGHTALGGGNMALFGTGCLHTWAKNLEELDGRFSDDRKIDRKILFDDSGYRGFYWANYSTSLGAAMHELGHTFNLPHTNSGIMGRGFDDMNCFFMCHKSAENPGSIEKQKSELLPYKDRGAHWHRSSAAILDCCRWIGNKIDDTSPIEVPVPIMYGSPNERGPVGAGFSESIENVPFDSSKWLADEKLTIAGFRVKAGKYVNAIQFLGKQKITQTDATLDVSLVSSEWFGNQDKHGNVHEFMLTDEEEKLISLDVRAGSWVDSIRFQSSKKSSVWVGGTGGNLHNLKFDDENGFEGLFGTAGDHVTSIGIRSEKESRSEEEQICYFYSEYGIRIIEVQKKDGEVIKHWEFLDGEPKCTIKMALNELDLEGQTATIAVYDGCGERAEYSIKSFF